MLNGQPFHLYRWGDVSLPPLLMLHGFPEHGGAWADLAPLLADRFHCVAPDQRGYGRSWAPEGVGHYRLSQLVSDMAALADHLGGTVRLLGHDWGASVAYGLAMAHPSRVSRLAIVNGVHPAPFQRELAKGGAQSEASQYINTLRRPGSEDYLSADNYAKLFQLFSANMDLTWLTPARRADYLAAWSHDGGRLRSMIDWYRASPLKVAAPGQPLSDPPDLPLDRMKITCPHLLIWGLNDTALLPVSTDGLETFAPDLTRAEIAQADHWVIHQQPDRVAQLLRDWL
ncbi:alpha/beta fold hydrolase [Marinibacterium profundimaris]|uniref:Alpha/beta hydrolase n=1 Tax=Marinibacterium profundimaris TaxID=1679460 RepID=A0A225NGY2_9RHOB|nr:alpha/beta hydrolase [Marinibacterium profundimaris]OWU69039.1 alpha/beta hydrolase [Marinibacterium profundimaris]